MAATAPQRGRCHKIKKQEEQQANVIIYDMDEIEWLERMTANAIVETVLGSIPALAIR